MKITKSLFIFLFLANFSAYAMERSGFCDPDNSKWQRMEMGASSDMSKLTKNLLAKNLYNTILQMPREWPCDQSSNQRVMRVVSDFRESTQRLLDFNMPEAIIMYHRALNHMRMLASCNTMLNQKFDVFERAFGQLSVDDAARPYYLNSLEYQGREANIKLELLKEELNAQIAKL